MFERPSKSESYRQLVRATEDAPVRFECIPPTLRNAKRVSVYIYRASRSLGVRVRVVTVDEYGEPLPPGELSIVRPEWTPDAEESN